VAKVGTSKADGTISQQAAVHIRGLPRTPIKEEEEEEERRHNITTNQDTIPQQIKTIPQQIKTQYHNTYRCVKLIKIHNMTTRLSKYFPGPRCDLFPSAKTVIE
jgi:hypothetical protein